MAPGFREAGYLPEAVVNFLALLGWNPGSEQELFRLDELVDAFSLERINKAGAKFDIEKAQWFNQQYIKEKPDSELAEYLQVQLQKEGVDSTIEKAETVCRLMKERVTFPQQIWTNARYFYQAPQQYDEKIVNKKWTEEASNALGGYSEALSDISGNLSAEQAKEVLTEVLEQREVKIGKVMPTLRLALTGEGGGPDLMQTIEVLGREETAQRIEQARERLQDRIKVSES